MKIHSLFSFKGELERKGFAYSLFFIIALSFLFAVILGYLDKNQMLSVKYFEILKILSAAVVLILWLPFIVRRLNDLILSEKWAILLVALFFINHINKYTHESGLWHDLLLALNLALTITSLFMLFVLLFYRGMFQYLLDNNSESSTSLDIENVRPFLQKLPKIVDSGLEDEIIEKMAGLVEDMEVGDERDMDIEVVFKGSPQLITFRVFIDNIDSAALYLFTFNKELTKLIDDEMHILFDEVGM